MGKLWREIYLGVTYLAGDEHPEYTCRCKIGINSPISIDSKVAIAVTFEFK